MSFDYYVQQMNKRYQKILHDHHSFLPTLPSQQSLALSLPPPPPPNGSCVFSNVLAINMEKEISSNKPVVSAVDANTAATSTVTNGNPIYSAAAAAVTTSANCPIYVGPNYSISAGNVSAFQDSQKAEDCTLTSGLSFSYQQEPINEKIVIPLSFEVDTKNTYNHAIIKSIIELLKNNEYIRSAQLNDLLKLLNNLIKNNTTSTAATTTTKTTCS